MKDTASPCLPDIILKGSEEYDLSPYEINAKQFIHQVTDRALYQLYLKEEMK